MPVTPDSYDLAELRRRVDELVAIAETVARGSRSQPPGMERLYAEVAQLAAVMHHEPPPPPSPAPRPRKAMAGTPSRYPTDYWYG
ncbi:MAG: hypothetical protein ACRDT4_06740 [Micromonosporaceae bacterium]